MQHLINAAAAARAPLVAAHRAASDHRPTTHGHGPPALDSTLDAAGSALTEPIPAPHERPPSRPFSLTPLGSANGRALQLGALS